jgi:hypothetical protein
VTVVLVQRIQTTLATDVVAAMAPGEARGEVISLMACHHHDVIVDGTAPTTTTACECMTLMKDRKKNGASAVVAAEQHGRATYVVEPEDVVSTATHSSTAELSSHVIGLDNLQYNSSNHPLQQAVTALLQEEDGMVGLERMGKILVPASILERERLDDEAVLHRTQSVAGERESILATCSHCRVLGTVRRGASPEGLPLVTMCEVRTHCVAEDCWILCRGIVYDATLFLKDHPGGQRALLKRAGGGEDCQVDYDFHSPQGRLRWKEFAIAKHVPCRPVAQRSGSSRHQQPHGPNGGGATAGLQQDEGDDAAWKCTVM